jgi:hypothetical protein
MIDLEFLKQYPISSIKIKDWFHERMIESFKDPEIAEEFKEFILEQGIEFDKIAMLINSNPRMLFDIFDENEIFISINIKDRKFSYRIDNVINPTEYSTRKECELISITRAFEILEEKLTPIYFPKVEE